jgi:hypothetical protein
MCARRVVVCVVDECQCNAYSIVRRARLKLSMRWFYAEAQATVLLNDGFAVLDRERSPMSTSWAANGSDWFDVSGDRVRQTSRASACRALHQRPL